MERFRSDVQELREVLPRLRLRPWSASLALAWRRSVFAPTTAMLWGG